ncbi:Protein humpback-1 [Aphelenchoides fujianensis]|nr:Protein humpback-1 [Aphelenchoides fujianensis]
MDRNHVVDCNDLQTRTAQQILRPIIELVTTLQPDHQRQRGGPSAAEALKRVEDEVKYLLHKTGQEIVEAERNRTLSSVSLDSLEKARNDVIAVGRRSSPTPDLLIVADMLDANEIDQTAQAVSETIDHIRECRDQRELVEISEVRLKEEIEVLTRLTRRRFPDLAHREDRDNLQSAMALLKITTPILISASKVHIASQGAEEPAVVQRAAANRQFAYEDAKDALHGVSEVMNRRPPREPSGAEVDVAYSHLEHKLKDLQRHLRRAIIDQVSDAFKCVNIPLEFLLRSAELGDLPATEQHAAVFREQAQNLCRIARLVCKISPDPEGVGEVRYAAHLLERLTPQVVDAAFLACLRPHDAAAKENLHEFAKLWQLRADAVTRGIDSLISADDFVAVTQAHINEDVQTGIMAILNPNHIALDDVAGKIRGRCLRVDEVVNSALEEVPASSYSENVRNATLLLRESLPEFEHHANGIITRVQRLEEAGGGGDLDEIVHQMIDACEPINHAVESVRHALLMNRNLEDVDSDNEYEEGKRVHGTATGLTDQRSQVSDSEGHNELRAMRHLPEEKKQEIQKEIEGFKVAQRPLPPRGGALGRGEQRDRRPLQADGGHPHEDDPLHQRSRSFAFHTRSDRGGPRGVRKGPSAGGVGARDRRQLVESATKKDLLHYITQVQMLCHQLGMMGRVKSEVVVIENETQANGVEVRVSETATTLLQNARNLLKSVTQAVKYAEIASTKHRRKDGSQRVVEWKLASPQKQQSTSHNVYYRQGGGVVRRVSERRVTNEMHAVQIR